MKNKKLIFNTDARDKILSGVTQLENAVKVTLGPKGRNVAIERAYGSPLITKDGVTVAKEIKLEDSFENMGAQMVKDVASKTNSDAGDGTTTATVLAAAIYREGRKSLSAGANPIFLKRGIDKAVKIVVDQLAKISKKIDGKEEIRQIAIVSANWDESIGNIIADAMNKVGKDGTITIDSVGGFETTLDVVEGMQFDKGYSSPYFADPETSIAKMEDTFVLVIEKKLNTYAPFIEFLKQIQKAGKPLVIIAEEVEGEFLAFLVVNRMRSGLNVCAVKAPGFGDKRRASMDDIAILTGATLITDDLGFDLTKLGTAQLGQAKKIVVTKDSTTITGGTGNPTAIQSRIKMIRSEIDKASSDFAREKLQERLAKLSGGVAVIKPGAATEAEIKEKKDRVEDALHATRAAIQEGIVPGGGTALLRCAAAIDNWLQDVILDEDEKMGVSIIRKAIEAPIKELCFNAGVSGEVVVDKILAGKNNFGYNVATGVYEDLVKTGVIDPTKVTRCALQNAASIAGLLLTTECMIADIVEKIPQFPISPQPEM
jgi:chaperonin GroEL